MPYNLRKRYPAAIVDLFEERLLQSHQIHIRGIIYSWNYNRKYTIDRFHSGQVDVDREQRPHRRLECVFERPERRFDLAINDIIQIWYEVECPELMSATYDWRDPWIKIPIFYGLPQSLPKTKGSTVTLVGVGYEQRYNFNRPARNMVAKNTRNSDGVRKILNDWERICGASRDARFSANEKSKHRLATNYFYGIDPAESDRNVYAPGGTRTIGLSLGETTPWGAAKKLAAGAGGWLLYWGCDGYCVLRSPEPHPKPAIILNSSNAKLLAEPEGEQDWENFRNGVVIYGQKMKNGRFAKGEAWTDDATSPANLRWRIPEVITGAQAGSNSAARGYAKERLKIWRAADLVLDTTNLIDPRLQEYDWMRVDWFDRSWTVPIISFTIPFKGGTQTISSKQRRRPAKMYNLARRRLK